MTAFRLIQVNGPPTSAKYAAAVLIDHSMETDMNIKKSSLLALLAFAAVPLTSQAGDSATDAAFDACIKAFTTSYIPNHPIRKTRSDTSALSLTTEYYKPSSYTVEVRARGAKSGQTIAEARCLVDGDRVVLLQNETKYAVTVQE